MKKRKNIAIPMILAATIAAVSVPCSSQIVMASDTYQVGVSKGYLALRSAMAYDSSNEIGELYSGDTVEVTEYTTSDYWYVYSPKLNRSGYVNNDYLYFLSSQPTSSSGSYTVSVAKGYLALRSAKAYDSSNEIGQLYSGDTVTVSDSSDPQYWYVYSPKLNLSGYVNKDYYITVAILLPVHRVLPEIQGLSVLPRVIWLCVPQKLMIPPMRSDSCIPAIQFSLSTPAIPSTGTFTLRS